MGAFKTPNSARTATADTITFAQLEQSDLRTGYEKWPLLLATDVHRLPELVEIAGP